MCAFVWMMIAFTVLTFELLNLKSCYVALPVSSLIATSSYSSVPCYWSLLLGQEMPSSAFVRRGRDPAIQADGPTLSAAPVGRQSQSVVRRWEPQKPSPGGFWGQQELLLVQKGRVCWLFSCGWGTWALCRGRVLLWMRPVPAQARELHTVLKWQTSPWKEMHTMSWLFQLPSTSFSQIGKYVSLRLFTGWE